MSSETLSTTFCIFIEIFTSFRKLIFVSYIERAIHPFKKRVFRERNRKSISKEVDCYQQIVYIDGMKNQRFIPQSTKLSALSIACNYFVKKISKKKKRKMNTSHMNSPSKPSDKGARNGTCNITRCENKPAIHFNRVMEKYYCTRCARKLNANMAHDGVALCSWPKPEHVDPEIDELLPDAPVDYFPEAGR